MDYKKTGTPAIGSPLNKIAHGAPLKNRITNVTGMDEEQLSKATAHNERHASGKINEDHSPAKHLNHGPWSNADHSIGDHAKNFMADPMGTTKKVVKQTAKKIKKTGENVIRNVAYGATYGPIFDAFGYDHPFGGKSNPSVKSEKYGGKKTKTKTKTKTKRRTKKEENKPTGREGWKTY